MEKKTKLTISGSAKKSIRNIEIAKTQGKNSRVIEKQGGKFANRGGSFRPGVGKPKKTPTPNTPPQKKVAPTPKRSQRGDLTEVSGLGVGVFSPVLILGYVHFLGGQNSNLQPLVY